jgi:hypothetical protein
MNDTNTDPNSRDHFGPRGLLFTSVALHILAGLLFPPLVLTAFVWSFGELYPFRSEALPYRIAALFGIALFIWAWRRRQFWLPAVAFTLFTIVFWFAVVLPYTPLIRMRTQ